MPSPFVITSATNTILLDGKRQGNASFTVSNISGKEARGRARIVSKDPAIASWLTLDGETERAFSIAGTQQYAVHIAVPQNAAAGNKTFSLEVVDVENPDENATEGPAVEFQVSAPVDTRHIPPLWIFAVVIVAVLIVVGSAIAIVNGQNQSRQHASQTATAQVLVAATQTAIAAAGAQAAETATAQAAATQTAVANQTVPVPDITLNTRFDAEQAIIKAGLKVSVTEQTVGLRPGLVAKQSPAPGIIVSKGSVVNLVVEAAVNLAVGKAASQSSIAFGGAPERAVDGNTDGVYNDGSVSHTDNTNQPWWQVDLGQKYNYIQRIVLWNRTDCCNERLSDFYVFVSDAPFNSNNPVLLANTTNIWNQFFRGAAPAQPPTQFTVNHSGRYVRVQLSGSAFLSLAEVQVWGY